MPGHTPKEKRKVGNVTKRRTMAKLKDNRASRAKGRKK